MMKPNDTAPRAKNFYREEDYFSLNVRNGVVRSPTGVRLIGLPEEVIAGLHAALVDETGDAAPVVLYQCGKWWGKQFWKKHGLEVRHFYQHEVGSLPLHFQQQVLSRVWAMYGWGLLETSFDLRDKGFVEASVQNALYSDVVGNLGRTSDHLIAGALASITTELAGRELDCVETSCRSKGDAKCTFLIGLKSRLDVVGEWVKQGRSRSQIHEALLTGEQ